ncbi:MAG: alpha/beta fold hydrolase [Pseudomonadales bacterium]
MKQAITVWSEGTRLAADLFTPDAHVAGEQRPGILLCHGWAGPKSQLSKTYAPYFCEAGFVCLTFDYRGWYDSDARLVTMEPQPLVEADGYMTVRARPIREVVDPLDQNRDIHNALAYLLELGCVDPARVGLWGSSYGGGHVIYVGGTDPRIKAIVSQVPGMGQAPGEDGFADVPPASQHLAAQMARGEVEIVPRSEGIPASLKGAGDLRTMWRYLPRVAAGNIRAPTLIIDQEEEEYGGRENSGLAAKSAIPETVTSEYHVLPGSHYDIYDKNFKQSADLARQWFLKYL